jgi:adenine phosphoribosyltransferase
VTLAHDLAARFAWVDGHADVWRLFADGALLERIADALAAPYAGGRVDKVAGIEARGFLLGAAVALRLGVGFAAIRKEDGLMPGPKATVRTAPDYRGRTPLLRLQRAAVARGERVVLVDDWIERGSQAAAARALVDDCGGELVGIAVVVDELEDDAARAALPPLHALVRAADLGPSGG